MEDYGDLVKGKRVVPLTNNEHADLQFKLEMLLEAITVLRDHLETRMDELEEKLSIAFDNVHMQIDDLATGDGTMVEFVTDDEEEH